MIWTLVKKAQNYWHPGLRKKSLLDCGTKVSFYHNREHGLILHFICERASYSYRSPEL